MLGQFSLSGKEEGGIHEKYIIWIVQKFYGEQGTDSGSLCLGEFLSSSGLRSAFYQSAADRGYGLDEAVQGYPGGADRSVLRFSGNRKALYDFLSGLGRQPREADAEGLDGIRCHERAFFQFPVSSGGLDDDLRSGGERQI